MNSNQKDRAIELGYIDFLPNATQLVYKTDNTINIGQVGGNNSILLSQSNLPNISLTGVTDSAGLHSHPILTRQDNWDVSGGSPAGGPSFGRDNGPLGINHHTSNSGEHNHSITIPLGGSDEPIILNPMFLNSNSFIFLGN